MMQTVRYKQIFLSATALGVSFGLVAPSAVKAQDVAQGASEGADDAGPGNEIIVTAARRQQDVTKLPFNIAVVGAEDLRQTGATSVEDLARQVPNLNVTSSGNRFLGAQRQVMRGINATSADRRGVAIEQGAVTTYLDNSPYASFFPLKDIERVEVLRGPQGTLYGAGTLSGAIRLITVEPKLESFSGSAGASIGTVAHSKDLDYGFEGVINVPLGSTVAIRAQASYDHSAGFIDQYGSFVREGGAALGAPVLADPQSPLTSASKLETLRDVNSEHTTFVRIAAKWEPSSAFKLVLAYNYAKTDGFGPNVDNPRFDGGPDPFDPTIVHPDTGKYEIVQRAIEPFTRKSQMWTGDASLDVGFATLSATTSFFETDGSTIYDATLGTAALPPAYVAYYTGSPVNPRYNAVQDYSDRNRSFTSELRLVSNGKGPIDYVVGLFYQNERKSDFWNGYSPGQFVYNNTPGVTNPSGLGTDDRNFMIGGSQKFTDKAVFGDLTWHVADNLDITGGVRFFEQRIARAGVSEIDTFSLSGTSSNSVKFSSQVFKANISYQHSEGHQVYATFSQGFRRGGANAFALSGFLFEPAELLDYQPDKLDNFEIGFKGRFGDWRYTVDGFVDNWTNPQIGGFTPYNVWPVTLNASKAQSKGVELELGGPITSELRLSFGYSYTEAKLTRDFCLPVGLGDGVSVDPCGIYGTKGAVLPSAPKHSGTASLTWQHDLGSERSLTANINANYKSSTRLNIENVNLRYPLVPSTFLANASLSYADGPWALTVFARNIFDRRVVYSTYTRFTPFEPLDLADTIGRPRQLGATLRYRW
jgi:outer membrane receptor protein involved in Fe transport